MPFCNRGTPRGGNVFALQKYTKKLIHEYFGVVFDCFWLFLLEKVGFAVVK